MEHRKWLDFIVILMISILVVTASAAVYNYMYMDASISAEVPYIKFVSGNDATSTIGTNGTWAKITDMAGWPNVTRVYEDALRIENTDTSDHNCTLMYNSWSGDTSYILSIYVKICNSVGGTQQGSTLSVTAQNSTGTITVPATTTYYVQWEIRWNGTALSTHTVDVTLQLLVP